MVDKRGLVMVEHSYRRPAIEPITYSLFYTPVLASAIWGIYLSRAILARAAILWCIAATFVGVHALYFPATRYRAPMEFVLLLYVSVATHHVAHRCLIHTAATRPPRDSTHPEDEESGRRTRVKPL